MSLSNRESTGPTRSAPAPKAFSEGVSRPLGARLMDAGVITEDQLDLALREKKRKGIMLGAALVDLGFVDENLLTFFLASESETEFVNVRDIYIEDDVLNLIDYDTVSEYKALPISKENGILTVALSDAFNIVAIDHLEKVSGMPVNVVTASEQEIQDAITRNFSKGSTINDTIDLIMNQIEGGTLNESELSTVESPVIRLVEQIIVYGIKQKATDIHIAPDEKILRIRNRVDGILRQEILIPKPIQPSLIARIKLISDLNITETRIPQDGRIKFEYGQRDITLRTSTLPTSFGESVVLRILDSTGGAVRLSDLGFTHQDKERFTQSIHKPFGMILVTGPTGSGKTTTLYSALAEVDVEHRSVFTLEDPIEYSLGWVRQTQVQPDIGMNFATGLRSLLRQDPDVILIGEIRDQETAQLATRAALTGHLVLSTLHTNTAVGVIPRLIDMGVEPYLLPSSLLAVVGQRLVRKLCTHCRLPVDDIGTLLSQYYVEDYSHLIEELWEPQGCPECNSTGYKGRLAIYEVMTVNDSFHEAIMKDNANTQGLKTLAINNGMTTMLEDGLRKASEGLTSVGEVIRVVR